MTILCTTRDGRWQVIKVYGADAADINLAEIAYMHGYDAATVYHKFG